GDDAKEVLGAQQQKKQHEELETTIEEALRAQLQDDIKKKKWDAAVAKIDAWTKKGDADDEQGRHLLATVRGAVAPEIIASSGKAVGSRDADKVLKQMDALVKL